jgi:hypothetical protein
MLISPWSATITHVRHSIFAVHTPCPFSSELGSNRLAVSGNCSASLRLLPECLQPEQKYRHTLCLFIGQLRLHAVELREFNELVEVLLEPFCALPYRRG